MVLAQEHWAWDPNIIDERSSAARAMGWKSLWAPALRLKSKRGSGGCCVFVHESWGLQEAEQATLVPKALRHRVLWCIVEPPGGLRMLVASAYLVAGLRLGPQNTDILQHLGA
eukprot:8824463-Lingulodinium_polyedra.AAC.1